MGLKVYISGMSGNKEVKKRQQRVLMILDSKNIKYDVIDITEPGKEKEKETMQTKSTSNGATVSDPEPRYPLPPQLFNENEYCGDYCAFDLANEIDTLEQFLKLETAHLTAVSSAQIELKKENGEIEKDSKDNIKPNDKEVELVENHEKDDENKDDDGKIEQKETEHEESKSGAGSGEDVPIATTTPAADCAALEPSIPEVPAVTTSEQNPAANDELSITGDEVIQTSAERKDEDMLPAELDVEVTTEVAEDKETENESSDCSDFVKESDNTFAIDEDKGQQNDSETVVEEASDKAEVSKSKEEPMQTLESNEEDEDEDQSDEQCAKDGNVGPLADDSLNRRNDKDTDVDVVKAVAEK